MFQKKKRITEDLIDFSISRISTGQIGGYITNVLYEQFGFKHIGYRIENIEGDVRCFLYTVCPANKLLVYYFRDRCSGMIEEDVMKAASIPHSFSRWKNGFEEVDMAT